MKIKGYALIALMWACCAPAQASDRPWTDAQVMQALKEPERGTKLVDAVAAHADTAKPLDLFAAAQSAFHLGRLEDAGFLFFAGRARTLVDVYAYSDASGANPALYALSSRIKTPLLPALIRDPAIYAGIARRFDAWPLLPPAGYEPGWEYGSKKSDAEISVRADEVRRVQSQMLNAIAALQKIPEYHAAIVQLQTDSKKAEASTLQRRQSAYATVARIEQERGLTYFTQQAEPAVKAQAQLEQDGSYREKPGPGYCSGIMRAAVSDTRLAILQSCVGAVMGKPITLKVKNLATGADEIEPIYLPDQERMLGFEKDGSLLTARIEQGEGAVPSTLIVSALKQGTKSIGTATLFKLPFRARLNPIMSGDGCWLMSFDAAGGFGIAPPPEPKSVLVSYADDKPMVVATAQKAIVHFWNPAERNFVVTMTQDGKGSLQTYDCAGKAGALRPGLRAALDEHFSQRFRRVLPPEGGAVLQLQQVGDTGDGTRTPVFFDLSRDKKLPVAPEGANPGGLTGFVSSRDGRWMALMVNGGLAVYSASDGKRVRMIPMKVSGQPFDDMAFTPDGSALVVWFGDGFYRFAMPASS